MAKKEDFEKELLRMADRVLAELDHFAETFAITDFSTGILAQQQRRRKDEPFVALVEASETVEGGPWVEKTYLVCRGFTPGIDARGENTVYADRDTPKGSLASVEPRDEITIVLPRGKSVTVRVKAKDILLPRKFGRLWDALNNRIAIGWDEDFIASLRELVAERGTVPGDRTLEELDQLEREYLEHIRQLAETKVHRVREIVDSIALKDQPILDRFQDEFCRRPLRSQLILSGSPGTGKTTSIIKRIAMKSSEEHLRETENLSLDEDRRDKWLIFTPNDLLKMYLKEAMNKEGLLATEHYVSTWDKMRTLLGRDDLRFLRVGEKGLFKKTSATLLLKPSSSEMSKAARLFLSFFDNNIATEVVKAISSLAPHELKPEILTPTTLPIAERFREYSSACDQIRGIASAVRVGADELVSIRLIEELARLSDDYKRLRSSTDDLVSSRVDKWIRTNPAEFDDIVEYLQNNEQPERDPELVEDSDDYLDDETVDEKTTQDPRVEARKRIRRSILAGAEAQLVGRAIRDKETRFIWDYTQTDTLEDPDLPLIAHLSLALRPRIFRVADWNALLRELPRSYQRFRTEELSRATDHLFFADAAEAIRGRQVSSDEIDLLIYSMLRVVSQIEERDRSRDSPDWSRGVLKSLSERYRTQIAVDEASDFSSLQLASIYLLTHPDFRSVVFSGDLMQRVTNSGLTSWDELTGLIPSVKRVDLIASYRQTPTLLRIAKKLYEEVIGEPAPFDSKYDGDGNFPAALGYRGQLGPELADWLADRVYEIYMINGEALPSIAVFVPTENDILPTSQVLKEALNAHSIDVEPCMMGKVLGAGSNVRIFSIEYIKGLEFEGVFYIDVDRVADSHPDLVDKYLYVGLTRATTFLGITYSSDLPENLAFLRGDFVEGTWREFL